MSVAVRPPKPRHSLISDTRFEVSDFTTTTEMLFSEAKDRNGRRWEPTACVDAVVNQRLLKPSSWPFLAGSGIDMSADVSGSDGLQHGAAEPLKSSHRRQSSKSVGASIPHAMGMPSAMADMGCDIAPPEPRFSTLLTNCSKPSKCVPAPHSPRRSMYAKCLISDAPGQHFSYGHR